MSDNTSLAIPSSNINDLSQLTNVNSFIPQMRIGDRMSGAVDAKIVVPGECYISSTKPEETLPTGTFGPDTDGISKGIFTGIPLAFKPHALWIENNKVKLESFSIGDANWRQIEAAYNSKPRPQGVMIGVDVLYHIAGDQFNFNKVADPKARESLQKKFGNGAEVVLYYKNTARGNVPTASRPNKADNTLTQIKVKTRMKEFNTYKWWVPEEHVKIKGSIPATEAMISSITKFLNTNQTVEDASPLDR